MHKPPRKRSRPRSTMVGFDKADPAAPGPPPPKPKSRAPKSEAARRNLKRKPRWTPERMQQYCTILAEHGRPGDAARAVGTSKRNVVRKRESCPEFDQMVLDALEQFKEWTIARVQQHAWEGVREPIYQGGELVGDKTAYSTQLQVLEARRVVPEYRERHHVEVSGDASKPVRVDLTSLSDEELAKLESLVAKVAGRGRPLGDDGEG